MNIGYLFLKVSLTGIITFLEFNRITNQQLKFNRLEESTAVRLGTMFDLGIINIGFQLTA